MEKDPLFDDPRGWSPYGVYGRELGLAAVSAADALADEPDWDGNSARTWLQSDHLAFDRVAGFADGVHAHQADLYICRTGTDPRSENNGDHFNEWVFELHAALPFSESERHWLARKAYGYRVQHHKADAISRQVGRGVNEAGRRRDICGSDLLGSFWAWRRDIFEFEGAGSLDVAIDALRSIGQILLRNVPDYASYISPNTLELDAVRKARRAQREAERQG